MKTILAILLNLMSASAFGTNFNHMTIDGIEYYAWGCKGLSIGKNGPIDGITPIKNIPPPTVQTIPISSAFPNDFLIHLSRLGKLDIIPAEQSRIDIAIYSNKKSVDVSSRISADQSPGKLKLTAVKKLFGGSLETDNCIMQVKNGDIVALDGTCAIIKIYVGKSDLIKIYEDGVYVDKSPSAKITYFDISTLLPHWNSEATAILKEFVSQEGVEFIDNQILPVISAASPHSEQLKVLKTMAPKLTNVSTDVLKSILRKISLHSARVEAIKILKEKLSVESRDLSDILAIIDFAPANAEVTGLLAGSAGPNGAALTGADIVAMLKSGTADSKLKTLKSLEASVTELSGVELIQIVKADSLGAYKVKVIELLKDKSTVSDSELITIIDGMIASEQLKVVQLLANQIQSVSGENLVALVKTVSIASGKAAVVSELKSKVSQVTSKQLNDIFKSVSISSSNFDVFKALISKIPPQDLNTLEPILEKHLMGSNLRDAKGMIPR